MKRILQTILVTLCLWWAGAAHAQSYTWYYFSDCESDLSTLATPDPDCQVGSNSNAGTSPSAPKQNWSGFTVSTLPACSGLRLAKGGVWTNLMLQVANNNSTRACPFIVEEYTPTWASGDELNPTVASNTSGIYGARLAGNSTRADKDGYILRNLRFRGTRSVVGSVETASTSEFGIFSVGSSGGVIIEGMDIRGFGIAIELSTTKPRTPGAIIRNNNIQNNGQGIHGNCIRCLIENNDIHDNATDATDAGQFNHNLYLGEVKNGTVRKNRLWGNSVQNSDGRCTSVQFVVHGEVDGLDIDGNEFDEALPAHACYAIAVDPGYATQEYFRNVKIRNNKIFNAGGIGIGLTACNGCEVYNNVLVKYIGDGIGISSPSNALQLGAKLSTTTNYPDKGGTPKVDIYNNTVYFHASTNNNSTGIQYNPSDINGGVGAGHRIAGNVIYFGGSSAGTGYCFKMGSSPNATTFPLVGANTCYHATGTAAWSDVYSTLSAAQAAGFGVGDALGTDPLITIPTSGNGYDVTPQAGSPLLGAAHATLKSNTGWKGRTFNGARDRGAVQRTTIGVIPHSPSPVFKR